MPIQPNNKILHRIADGSSTTVQDIAGLMVEFLTSPQDAPGGQAHALRNVSSEPVIELIVTSPRLGEWFQQAGRPISGIAGPLTPDDLAHLMAPVKRASQGDHFASRTSGRARTEACDH